MLLSSGPWPPPLGHAPAPAITAPQPPVAAPRAAHEFVRPRLTAAGMVCPQPQQLHGPSAADAAARGAVATREYMLLLGRLLMKQRGTTSAEQLAKEVAAKLTAQQQQHHHPSALAQAPHQPPPHLSTTLARPAPAHPPGPVLPPRVQHAPPPAAKLPPASICLQRQRTAAPSAPPARSLAVPHAAPNTLALVAGGGRGRAPPPAPPPHKTQPWPTIVNGLPPMHPHKRPVPNPALATVPAAHTAAPAAGDGDVLKRRRLLLSSGPDAAPAPATFAIVPPAATAPVRHQSGPAPPFQQQQQQQQWRDEAEQQELRSAALVVCSLRRATWPGAAAAGARHELPHWQGAGAAPQAASCGSQQGAPAAAGCSTQGWAADAGEALEPPVPAASTSAGSPAPQSSSEEGGEGGDEEAQRWELLGRLRPLVLQLAAAALASPKSEAPGAEAPLSCAEVVEAVQTRLGARQVALLLKTGLPWLAELVRAGERREATSLLRTALFGGGGEVLPSC